ncbi:MAG: DUF4097 family beta strand repeat-containing protein [Actinomycetes bacterium]
MNTFPTHGPINAVVELSAGDINVTASDRGDAVASVKPRDAANPADVAAADNAIVEFANGILVVKTTKALYRIIGPSKKDGSVIVTVELPTGSALSATTGMGLIHSEGDLADTIAKTGMGDVRLDRVGSLNTRTGIGDITVDDIAGDAKVTTGTGSVRLGNVKRGGVIKNSNGTVEIAQCDRYTHVRTASGNIVIGRALSSVSAGSAAGDIRIDEVSAGSVTARTGAGAISIGIREGAAAWLEVTSKYGSVRNGLTACPGPAESESTVEVRARTGAGDITIDHANAA